MDMLGMDMSAGSMSMGAGVPSLFHIQKMYWAFVGAAIAAATATNVINIALCRQRLRALSKNITNPSKPTHFITQSHATITAIGRELGYYAPPPIIFRRVHVYFPTLGPIGLILANFVLIIVLCFYRLDPSDQWAWEDIGYRVGFVAMAQLPLIILLAGKRNIIGFLTGCGYERLNWLHRWVARCLFATVLIHMGYWFTDWARYDYIMVKLSTDAITQKGMAAFAILAWIILSSVAPIRGLSYEFFLIQHIISYLGFLTAVYLHVPAENKIWIWLPLAFWAFDRVVRFAYLTYNNLSFLHPKVKGQGLLACKATFEPLGDEHTRVTINNPPITWKPGQHVFLACHPLAPLASHPFTIASLPSDNKMEFIIRAHKGATRRFFRYAAKTYPTLPAGSLRNDGRSVMIEGPYSRIRPLRQFDNVILLAGSTGATFTMPLLRDLVSEWTGTSNASWLNGPSGAVTRSIRFIWIIKRSQQSAWFAQQLNTVMSSVSALREKGVDVQVEISIYVTCDNELTSGPSSTNDVTNCQTGAQEDESRSSSFDDEKKGVRVENMEVQGSDKGCCCTRAADEGEDVISAPCNCGQSPSSAAFNRVLSTTASTRSSLAKPTRLLDSRVSCLSGRPQVKNLLRKSVERAMGETAVVVCGPQGLVHCVRNSVVELSDERAVHKGTGAQGIYVHAEIFGY
jgi:predicted ferric reductase